MKILVLNGPNLNMLGKREPGVYGATSYEELKEQLADFAAKKGTDIEFFQSNSEGAIIDRINLAFEDNTDGIIINPGAYTHYSYAIRDALAMIKAPKIEVHISNVHTREEFRHTSVTAPVCTGQITGLGIKGYFYALEHIIDMNK